MLIKHPCVKKDINFEHFFLEIFVIADIDGNCITAENKLSMNPIIIYRHTSELKTKKSLIK